MTDSSSCDLFSHPGKKLRDHLTAVADRCESAYRDARPDFSSIGFSYDELSQFSRTLGLCHDFGKATPFFQEYLFADEKTRVKLKIKPETHHGLVSAVFAYYCIREFLKGKPDAQPSLLPFFSFVIVRRHHGDLINFFDETADLRNSEKIDVIKRQCASIRKDLLHALYSGLIAEETVHSFLQDIDATISSIVHDGKLFHLKPRLDQIQEDTAMEIFTLYFYSLLLDGDKLDAAGISVVRNKNGLLADLVDTYRKNRGFTESASPMNRLRNEIYEDVISKVGSLDLHDKIYSLNVPTGTGKTLTSVSFALKLRERISHETGISPQIVYCLPFMSIIDQNYEVISEVITSDPNTSPSTDILLKHHHLADVNYSTDDEDYLDNKAQLMIEGWHSEFVITTFVQFFHTIISDRNRAIRKYHTLANSIIILDEVQSIPHHYWLLFHDLLLTLSRFLNIHVVFVTATQPLIFDEKIPGEIRELASQKQDYFSRLDRIDLTFNREPQVLQDFIKKLRERIRTDSGKDFLIVLNTIHSAEEVYSELSSGSVSDTEYVFLSTHIIPKERLTRIRQLRDPKNKKRKVIVSTQLIEAGVDIDVDVVYRDMAPLDSINQVAGRCNRNSRENVRGEVQIVTLMNNEKELCKSIYSSFLLDKTRIVLEGKNDINEQQFLTLNNQYFRLVKELHSEDRAEDYLNLLRYLKFSDLHDSFHLIENDYPKMDVFVECDENASELWKQFVDIKSMPFPERRCNFLKIKREFLDHVISVSERDAKRLFREDLGIGHISLEELKIWYNRETGFTPNDGGALIL